MKPGLGQWIRDNGRLALVLAGLALWLGWKLLVELYYLLVDTSQGLFLHLEASYGQVGGWLGYALLGLGLGAAAGAAAAQRRYQLDRRLLLGAGLMGLGLLALAYLGSQWLNEPASAEVTAPMDLNAVPVEQPLKAAGSQAAAAPPIAPDTASYAADYWLTVPTEWPLLASWRDSLRPDVTTLGIGTILHVLRQTHGWGQVQLWPNEQRQSASTGWVRLAGLASLADPTSPVSQEPVASAAPPNAAAPAEPTAPEPSGPAANLNPAATLPTGHQQPTGQIGELRVQYALDWQGNGELSGSYYYEQQPGVRYHLTGSLNAAGELHLLEFTRGQQSAQGILYRQEQEFTGTLHTADGRQLPITISLPD